MCEFIFDVGRLFGHIHDIYRVVHGAGLSPEDLDKPQAGHAYYRTFATGLPSGIDWNCSGLVGR